ncbi:helix-turn-helix domain-containing protein [Candidatus Solincola sp.]|nr:helix-turn-helix domain-containing protein [Actinomycetota bacterium]MDI7253214.1 helix-turn-helix domain-containing protein [Actinomycetota bacterium]
MDDIGGKLRDLRRSRKLSIRQVAELTGFSVSFLSKLETGKTSITIKNLIKLLNSYGVTLAELFSGQAVRKITYRREDRRKIDSPEDVSLELLVDDPEAQMETLLGTFQPHARYRDPIKHGGEEFAMALKGEFRFELGREAHHLREGDCVYFRGEEPHAWENLSDEEGVLLMVITPPSV